jgi:hypothetical protein
MLMTRLIALRTSLAASALLVSLAVGPGIRSTHAADTAAAPPAHWVERTLDYTYMGFTTKYSCDGLRDNVRDVLLALGARKSDLKIQSRGCTRLNGPEEFPGVSAHFWVLQPLAPEDVGKAADPASNAARWQTVDLVRINGASWDQGQCELLEQMQKKVLPLFTSRNVNFHSSCFPHEVSPGEIQFTVDVLRPTPPAAATPAA